ncbi:MAG TPA: PDZ domain-containing protein [Candidatus Polarisedimenticolia bacterium]|nr:PDZ domain-containing protein [Candidatus Polarisedimenticolia bacterium]
MKSTLTRAALLLVVAALLAVGASAALPDQGPAGVASETVCPRCGYRSQAGWRHCAACGWDLRVLAGAEGAARLQKVGASVVGLILVKEPPSIEEAFPPQLVRQFSSGFLARYLPRRTKRFATAFPYSRPGLYVTSARALEWVEVADVRTYNNRIVSAQILGYDLPSGIGVLQANVPDALPLAASELVPGELDPAWAICYPVAVGDGTVDYLPEAFHRGRISAVEQDGTNLIAFEHLLRTDHTLEEGCQGGPLLDAYGAAAGMVLSSPDPGINFAVPAADLKGMVELLAEKKKAERPYFGVGLVKMDERRRARFDLPPDTMLPVVSYLVPGSPAEKAGVQPGDLLGGVGSEAVHSVAGAGSLLLRSVPGTAVSLKLMRRGKEMTLAVNPTPRPAKILLAPADEIQEGLQANLVEVDTGSTSQQGLRFQNLVRGGRGEKEGFHEGDLLISVDGKGVRHLETLNQIVRGGNVHIFGEKSAAAGPPRLATYAMQLSVKTAEKGEKEERYYWNLFPDVLSAPVY